MRLLVLAILAALFAWAAEAGYTADQVEVEYQFNSPVPTPTPPPGRPPYPWCLVIDCIYIY